MINKISLAMVILLVINLGFVPSAFASNNSEKEAKLANKVKTAIAKLGADKDSKVKIKLKDGTKLKGYVSEINENNFVVTNDKTGVATTVSYSQPKQVKGNNLSSGTIIAIGVVVAVFILGIIAASS